MCPCSVVSDGSAVPFPLLAVVVSADTTKMTPVNDRAALLSLESELKHNRIIRRAVTMIAVAVHLIVDATIGRLRCEWFILGILRKLQVSTVPIMTTTTTTTSRSH
jgi:hypothetical protein